MRTTLISCIALGLTALLIGLATYVSSMVRQYVRHGFEMAKRASVSAEHGAESIPLAEKVMEIYENLTPEQRALCGTEEYRNFYSEIDTNLRGGGTWDVLVHMPENFVINVDSVYLAMYDVKSSALVYIADESALTGSEDCMSPATGRRLLPLP